MHENFLLNLKKVLKISEKSKINGKIASVHEQTAGSRSAVGSASD